MDRARRRREKRAAGKPSIPKLRKVRMSDGRELNVQSMRMRPEQKALYEKMMGKALAEVQSTSDPLVLKRTHAKSQAVHEACEMGHFRTEWQGVPILMEMPDNYRESLRNQAREIMDAIARRREELGVIE